MRFFCLSLIYISLGFGGVVEFISSEDSPAAYREVIVTEAQKDGGFWGQLYYKLAKEGHRIVITNETRVGEGDVIVWGNIRTPSKLKRLKKLKSSRPEVKHVLVNWEPPLHEIELTKEVLDLFDRVVSWNDGMRGRPNFRKWGYPVNHGVMENAPGFKDRKLCAMILGGHQSTHPEEIYSMRRKLVEFYESVPGGSSYFDFYGWLWGEGKYKNHHGVPPHVVSTLSQYKFTFAFENWSNDVGYITEKIFAPFEAGSVPIYLGATNISEYIPEECFIDMRMFPSFEAMHEYLLLIEEEEWEEYRANIKKFLASEKGRMFTPEHQASILADAILH
jgi:hypothetical protein